MKEVKWQMKEQFTFPSKFGQPTSTEEVKVTPRFTEETVEGRPKLTGIYHLAVTVNFDKEETSKGETTDAVVIDDLDMKETTGYFEYAVPFNIDFPPEARDPVTIQTVKPSAEINNNQLAIIWEVACTYEEVGIHQQAEKIKTPKETSEQVTEKQSEQTNASQKQQVQAETEVEKPTKTEEASKSEVEEVTNDKANEPISRSKEVAIETVSTSEGDEVLDFIAELEDGVSATSFRLNDIFV